MADLSQPSRAPDYDVALSFAGEDRVYVEQVAELLRGAGLKVFYDKYEQVELWGRDLYQHLDLVYRQSAKSCIIFISENYARKLWTRHEQRSAQARAFEENSVYILPARFDDAEMAGMPGTIGYVDLRNLSPEQFSKIAIQKLTTVSSSGPRTGHSTLSLSNELHPAAEKTASGSGHSSAAKHKPAKIFGLGIVVVLIGLTYVVLHSCEGCIKTTALRDGPIDTIDWKIDKNPTVHLDVGDREKIVHAYGVPQDPVNSRINITDVKVSPDGKHATAVCSMASFDTGQHTNATGKCLIRGTVETSSGSCPN